MADRTRPCWPDSVVIRSLGFLLVSVPLVPYRYLVLPGFLPSMLLRPVQYVPVIVSVLLAAVWFWRRRRQVVPALMSVPLAIPVLALLLTGMVSSVGGKQPLVRIAKTLYYFLTGGLLYLVVVDALKVRRRTQMLLCIFLGGAYTAAVLGVLEFALGHSVLYSQFFAPENEAYRRLIPDPWFGRRIIGTIGHAASSGSAVAWGRAGSGRAQLQWGVGGRGRTGLGHVPELRPELRFDHPWSRIRVWCSGS